MPTSIRELVKSVLEELKQNRILPTPDEYRRVFCQKAKDYGFNINECDRLSKYASKLSQTQIKELEKEDIEDVDALFDFIVKKLQEKEEKLLLSTNPILSQLTLNKIASLMIASLVPSFCEAIEHESSIKYLTNKITQDPTLLENQEIQENLENLIEDRKNSDRKIVFEKTDKLNQLIQNMGLFLENTIEKSGDSNKNLSVLLQELEDLRYDEVSSSEFEKLKSKLIQINISMKDEIGDLSQKLLKEKNEALILKEKINSLERNLKIAQKESSTDFLTGLLTRRKFDLKLKEIEEEYQRTNNSYSIVFIDIDHFKSINDTYGHNAGDVVLSTFGKILKSKVSNDGIVARYGGEEFVIILKNRNLENSLELCDKIKDLIAKSKFIYDEIKIQVTFSAGIIERRDYQSLEEALKQADKYLYTAKNSGRDKVLYKEK
ncbi:MAG: diguanylate cyclase [Arcobacteraceae bacterium]|jgi:diguanylate cyclase (GGDEF)-like protein|nr:diguanylate cyclase [Arcobacteraceae bacterium]MDY0365172.1 diguanylate cyclase [Arcobacteraceae bacterium]